MLKKTIKYIDLNGIERNEDFYFNLSKPEIVKMQSSVKGGYDVQLKSIAADLNGAYIIEFFEDLIRKSYGEKSEDGRRFIKSNELSEAFMQTPAYEALFEELVTDSNAASEFVKAIMPSDIAEKSAQAANK